MHLGLYYDSVRKAKANQPPCDPVSRKGTDFQKYLKHHRLHIRSIPKSHTGISLLPVKIWTITDASRIFISMSSNGLSSLNPSLFNLATLCYIIPNYDITTLRN